MLQSDASYEMKKAIINALIHKIEIHRTGFKMGFYVGVGQVKKGEALASPLNSFSKNFLSDGSFLLKNGWDHSPPINSNGYTKEQCLEGFSLPVLEGGLLLPHFEVL